jgi:hypothetical protein
MITQLKERMKRGLGVFVAVASIGIGVSAASVLIPSEAQAVIGRPLTPLSFAGVARRTARRNAAAYAGGAYAAGAYPAAYPTAPPAGCAPAGGVYQCGGGGAYQPAYDGPNVVYVPVYG